LLSGCGKNSEELIVASWEGNMIIGEVQRGYAIISFNADGVYEYHVNWYAISNPADSVLERKLGKYSFIDDNTYSILYDSYDRDGVPTKLSTKTQKWSIKELNGGTLVIKLVMKDGKPLDHAWIWELTKVKY
jgi:hypothetical protein